MVRRFDAAVAQRLHGFKAKTQAYISTRTKNIPEPRDIYGSTDSIISLHLILHACVYRHTGLLHYSNILIYINIIIFTILYYHKMV